MAGIPEDGSHTTFSNNKEVEAAMGRAEAAFAKADWDEAIKEYQRALELDPKLYLAAVDIGDTYFRLKRWDSAGEWFARAVVIDPNQEVAYRYWADTLMADGKMKEARDKFIQGLVAFPYTQDFLGRAQQLAVSQSSGLQQNPDQSPARPCLGWQRGNRHHH